MKITENGDKIIVDLDDRIIVGTKDYVMVMKRYNKINIEPKMKNFIYKDGEIIPVDTVPPMIIEKHGIKHYLGDVRIQTDGILPRYFVRVKNKIYWLNQDGNYSDGKQTYDWTDLFDEPDSDKVIVGDHEFFINYKKGQPYVVYADEWGIKKVFVPRKVLLEQRVFTKEEIEKYPSSYIIKLPRPLKFKKLSNKSSLLMVYETDTGLDVYVSPEGISIAAKEVDPQTLAKIVDNKIFTKLASIKRDIHPKRSNYSGDWVKLMYDLVSREEFYGPLISRPTSKTLITQWGQITVRKRVDVNDPLIVEVIKYILGGPSRLEHVYDGKFVWLKIDERPEVETLYRHEPIIRLGNTFLCQRYDDNLYFTRGEIIVKLHSKGVKTITKGIIMGLNTIVPVSVLGGFKKGKPSIADILPGLKYDADKHEIEQYKYIIGHGTINTIYHIRVNDDVLSKTYYASVKYERDYVETALPFIDGMYLLHIPYDADVDAWSAKSIREVPKEWVVGEIVPPQAKGMEKIIASVYMDYRDESDITYKINTSDWQSWISITYNAESRKIEKVTICEGKFKKTVQGGTAIVFAPKWEDKVLIAQSMY